MKNNLLFVQRSLLLFALFLYCTISAHAQDWNQIIKGAAGDRDTLERGAWNFMHYGHSVAVSDDFAIVGSYDDGQHSDHNEEQFIYILYYEGGETWKQVKAIAAPKQGGFGYSVAINGEYAIIGAPFAEQDSIGTNDLTDAGAVFIYKKDQGGFNNWGLLKEVRAENKMSDDNFGYAVSISQNYFIASATGEDEDKAGNNTISNAGSAFIFYKNQGGEDNWGLVEKITAPERNINDNFGSSVSISGNYAMVGMPHAGINSGAAFIFQFDQITHGWGFFKSITAPVSSSQDYFGVSVAISGDYAVIGANMEDQNSSETTTISNAGSAYILQKVINGTDTWEIVKKITASSPVENDGFGYSVAIDGNYIVVGASGAGGAYIFEKDQGAPDNWGLVKNLAGMHIGYAVAINGDRVFTGNPDESYTVNTSLSVENGGACYLFQKNRGGIDNWGQLKKFHAMMEYPDDRFGYQVAISGNYAVVGAPNDEPVNQPGTGDGNTYMEQTGAAYIFYKNSGSWKQIKKITPTDPKQNGHFGISVSIDGSYVLIGANSRISNAAPDRGAAYIFKKDQGGTNNWGFIKKLTSTFNRLNDRFGLSLSIRGDYAIVGAEFDNYDISESNYLAMAGAAYLFGKNQGGDDNWGIIKKITAPVRSLNNRFGTSVSMDMDHMIIGVPYDNTAAPERGVTGCAYIYGKDNDGIGQWGLSNKVSSPEPTEDAHFGSSVAISGDYAIINNGWVEGGAYIFKKDQNGTNQWALLQTLNIPASNGQIENNGNPVAIDGDYAVAGTASVTGLVYVFKKDPGGTDNWEQDQTLTFPASSSPIGSAVAINGNNIIVGIYTDSLDASGANPIYNAGSVFFFQNSSVLPVTLATFDATKIENTALLQWATSAETNTDHFEILRSEDAKSWEMLGHMQAAKESSQLVSYTFTDSKPDPGENFYRLKIVDEDGSFTYSRIRNVSFDINGNAILYPNPVSEKLFFTETEINKIASVSIINVSGQTVLQVSKPTKEGIAIHQLSAGMYLVRIRKKNGNVQMKKVVVTR